MGDYSIVLPLLLEGFVDPRNPWLWIIFVAGTLVLRFVSRVRRRRREHHISEARRDPSGVPDAWRQSLDRHEH